MATSYSKYTGGANTDAAIYTVPTGKVAKIIVTKIDVAAGYVILIGEYQARNDSGVTVYSNQTSTDTTYTSSTAYLETQGMIVARRGAATFVGQCMMMKSSHILLEGETIKFNSASSTNSISFTVIEEDV